MPVGLTVYHLRHGIGASPGVGETGQRLAPVPGAVQKEGGEGTRYLWGRGRTGGPGGGGAALGRRAQREVHFQADVVLDAQDPGDAGLGQREVRAQEGDPGLDPGRGTGRPRI